MTTNEDDRTSAFAILDKLLKDAGLQYHEVQALEYARGVLLKETETCKFNCRVSDKSAYKGGYEAGWLVGTSATIAERKYDDELAYEEYCDEQRLD